MLPGNEDIDAPTSDCGDEHAAPTCYFSDIPLEVMSNVLRLCCSRPNRINCAADLSPTVLSRFLDSFPVTAAPLFRELFVHREFSIFDDDGLDSLSQMFFLLSFHPTMEWKAYAGEHLTWQRALLESVGNIAFNGPLSSSDATAMVRHCGMLRSLTLREERYSEQANKVLEARGKQLYTLNVGFTWSEMEHAITEHCTKLRELCMDEVYALPIVLPVLGAQLLKLDITYPIRNDDMDLIRKQCGALEIINIRTEDGPHCRVAHAKLLASYGNQLKHADLKKFDLETVLIVTSACPNFTTNVSVDDPLVLAELGSHVRFAQISTSGVNPSDFRNALMKCTALSHLILPMHESVDGLPPDETSYDFLERLLSPLAPLFPALYDSDDDDANEIMAEDMLKASARFSKLRSSQTDFVRC